MTDTAMMDPTVTYPTVSQPMTTQAIMTDTAIRQAAMARPAPATPLLEVKNLSLHHRSMAGDVPVLHEVSFTLARGEILGVIGESGAGKSTLGNALIGLPGEGFRRTGGTISVGGEPIDLAGGGISRGLQGRHIGAIFQDHTASLDPLMRIGVQIEETIRAADPFLSQRLVRQRALDLLARVGIAEPERRCQNYPHQFSGGQRQRIVIAIALAAAPDIIVADEPTSALDAVVQKQVLGILRDLADETGVAIVLVTHDMGVIAEIADRVVVMRGGRIVEQNTTGTLLDAPRDPYTRSLLAAVPRLRISPSGDATVSGEQPAVAGSSGGGDSMILVANNVSRIFGSRGLVRALSRKAAKPALAGVDIHARRGTVTGIIGESGSGKTTLGRIIAGLETASTGRLNLDGTAFDLTAAGARTGLLGQVQMIFQDPAVSLNPRMTVRATLAESIRFARKASGSNGTDGGGDSNVSGDGDVGGDTEALLTGTMDRLGLDRGLLERHPHQLSGGQKQRVCIARALLAKPRLIVADEPTSALDVSVQAGIVALLKQSVAEDGISMIFISHDLALVQDLCRDVYILKDGRIEDAGPAGAIFSRTANPYTRALIEARSARFVR